MKDETLLPCPFCGGKAEFDYDDDGLNWISCSTCGVSTDTSYHTDVDARETLRDVWNRRALQSGNSGQPVTVPAGYVLVSADFIDTVKQAFKEVGGRKSFPGHAHDVPGVWDSDNGEKANKPCAQCAMWSKLHDMLAAEPKPHDVPKAKNIIGHYHGADGKEQDIITLAAKNGDSKCWCRTCRKVTLTDMRFVVCPDCGNKRCPKANDHRNACSGSNEPGQEGSAYPDTPKGV